MKNLENKSIVFYPSFDKLEDLNEHYYRAIWYLNPVKNFIKEIIFPIVNKDLRPNKLPTHLDSEIRNIEKGFNVKIKFVYNPNDSNIKEIIKESDIVLQWANGNDSLLGFSGSHKKAVRINHLIEKYADSFYLKLSGEYFLNSDEVIEQNRVKFNKLYKMIKSEKGYIFGTGPSLKIASGFDFSNGIPIVCNSMVKNKELMQKLQPKIITVADPIFHAGCSSYAGEFRKHLISVMNLYGSYLIVPMRDYSLYINNLPKNLNNNIIGVPFKTDSTPNLNLNKNFYVTTTSNILTLFLLPLATTFFKEIYIMGCDGRPIEDNKYFWTHDPSSQLTDKMMEIQKVHPAFFKINFNDYYMNHCEILEKWISFAEQNNKKIINLTASYIPALKRRSKFISNPIQYSIINPKLSIIMPAYNAEDYIETTINSVQKQSYTDWELIVIEDGSADNTLQKVEKIATIDTRVKIYKNTNKGVSAARNLGISLSRGEYITFLDADDYYYPNAISNRIRALERNKEWNFVYCNVDVTDHNLNKLNWQLGKRNEVSFLDMYSNPIHIISLMGRSNIIKKYKFNEKLSNGEDWLFIADILRSGDKIYNVQECLVAYRQHSGSTVKKNFIGHEINLLKVINLIYSPVTDIELPIHQDYAQGLKTPDKSSVIAERYVKILTWFLLSDEYTFHNAIINIVSDKDIKLLPITKISTQIKYTFMRYYLCNSEGIKEIFKRDEERIRRKIKKLKFSECFPYYTKVFLSTILGPILDFKKEKLEELLSRNKIVIYGAGGTTRELFKSGIEKKKLDNIIALADLNIHSNNSIFDKKIVHPAQLLSIKMDLIVISVQDIEVSTIIKKDLVSFVPNNVKIIDLNEEYEDFVNNYVK